MYKNVGSSAKRNGIQQKDLIYGDEKHVSIASLPGMRERTITVNGFSKSYSMTGWRIGFVGIDESLMSPMIRAHQYSTVCVTTFAQFGAAEALTGPQDAQKAMVTEFGRRRDLVVRKLADMDLISFSEPKGAFYVMVNVSRTGQSASEVAAELLDHGVAVVPWDEIGEFSEGF
ncbi:MAG: aminotransferase class I/II-fold pyridoxal phosphate-dependent enzyme, partial [Okeania sp. SIO3B3]|nr:aminotransferase class I/II-fold pyridoxal phosphate-dependent enzyme [Okeania sp. SIO3B3]